MLLSITLATESDPAAVSVFRYEDLWTADGEQVRRLIEFCGLDPGS